jgi:hypothetical protein
VEKALQDYKAVVFPTTVLIGKDGKIKFARAGLFAGICGDAGEGA